MKTLKTILAAIVFIAYCLLPTCLFAQCLPMIKIDGNNIIADENNAGGIKLPSWLRAGQTLERGQYVFSIAVIEFTVNGTSLDYSQNLSITTPVQTVPANKVWKIESVHKDPAMAVPVTYTYTSSSTFTPPCSGTYRVQVWGAGGGGSSGMSTGCGATGGRGGGGGGYAEGNFFLTGGTPYTVTVGTGGTGGSWGYNPGTGGGTSSVGTISISATGGGGGTVASCGVNGAAGTGSGGQINLTGMAGSSYSGTTGGSGGNSAKDGVGGSGGASSNNGTAGNAPGGGGGAGGWGASGAAGADGKVVVSNAGTSSSSGGSSASRDRLQVTGAVNVAVNTGCGYVVPSGKIFRLDAVTTNTNGQWLYMGSSCGSNDRGSMVVYNPYSGYAGTSAILWWPYPQWYGPGTYFYYASGTAYLQGLEFEIEQ